MHKALLLISFSIVSLLAAGTPLKTTASSAQAERSLSGEWIVVSSPIDGKLSSPKGTTLGFPDRDMIFDQTGDIRTGVVLREDVGQNVRPLGVWRVMGDQFSATFQLWCPDPNGPCGSIVMRGQFIRDDRINGTMTAFFDQPDDSTPTGYDTWTFAFVGNRVAGGGTN